MNFADKIKSMKVDGEIIEPIGELNTVDGEVIEQSGPELTKELSIYELLATGAKILDEIKQMWKEDPLPGVGEDVLDEFTQMMIEFLTDVASHLYGVRVDAKLYHKEVEDDE